MIGLIRRTVLGNRLNFFHVEKNVIKYCDDKTLWSFILQKTNNLKSNLFGVNHKVFIISINRFWALILTKWESYSRDNSVILVRALIETSVCDLDVELQMGFNVEGKTL